MYPWKDGEIMDNKVHIFKPAMDLVQIKMEESDLEENKPLIDENAPLRTKKPRKKKPKRLLQPLDLSNPELDLDFDEPLYAGDIDLSEEFLITILKYVDDLCNIINEGKGLKSLLLFRFWAPIGFSLGAPSNEYLVSLKAYGIL